MRSTSVVLMNNSMKTKKKRLRATCI